MAPKVCRECGMLLEAEDAALGELCNECYGEAHGILRSEPGETEAVRRRFIELLGERTPNHPWVRKYRETGR